MKSAIVKRLPLIVAALLGLWLWQGGAGFLPTEREVIWQLPGEAADIRQVELQLWRGEDLLQRIELKYPQGASGDPVAKLSLKPGAYVARAFVRRAGGSAAQPFSKPVQVSDEKTVVASFR